jgi:hypothetical protein
MAEKLKTITCVLGFNLNLNIYGMNGEIIKSGICKTIYPETYRKPSSVRLVDKKWFNSFNQDLLDKIRDYQHLNS